MCVRVRARARQVTFEGGHGLKGEVAVGVLLADFVSAKTVSVRETIEHDGLPLQAPDGQVLQLLLDLELFSPGGEAGGNSDD
eukprot:COSAG02_NODE_8824_length_2430_cov_1.687822_4_plen_82_part_00